jgi:antitoxin (DNA-binding transcriptional repressor) of toxin-antitoxin stability system
MMTLAVTVGEAEHKLAELLSYIRFGEEVVIMEAGRPVARLMPMPAETAPRVPGSAVGQIEIMPDFDDPLPEEILELFEQ